MRSRGELALAEQQHPLVTADEHHGDPASTSVAFENDFALRKPLTITYERAFGGKDDTDGPAHVAVELRNPVGIGYHPRKSSGDIGGLPVPNIELPGAPVQSPRDLVDPGGFGVVDRAWQPRIGLAGTYDWRWLNERAL